MKKKPFSTDVACFGEALWDIYENPRRGDGKKMLQQELGGAPANVATGLARMGVRASVIGGVGADRFGEELCVHLEGDGVDTKHLLTFPNRTGVTFVASDERGEPSFLFYRHDSADMAIRAAHVKPAMAAATWNLIGTSTLVSEELREATMAFVEAGEQQGAHLFLDLNVRAHLWKSRAAMIREVKRVADRAVIVKASLPDLANLGLDDDYPALSKFAPNAVWVVTRSEGPASVYKLGKTVRVRAEKRQCHEATGAGDAFIAGLLSTLVAVDARPGTPPWNDSKCWTEALRIGHILGGKAISRVGAVSGLVRLEHARRCVEKLRGSLS